MCTKIACMGFCSDPFWMYTLQVEKQGLLTIRIPYPIWWCLPVDVRNFQLHRWCYMLDVWFDISWATHPETSKKNSPKKRNGKIPFSTACRVGRVYEVSPPMNRHSHNQISSTFSSRRLGIHPIDQVGNLAKSDHQKTLTTNKRNAPTRTHPPGLLVPFELPSRYSRTATFLHAASRFGGPNPWRGAPVQNTGIGEDKKTTVVSKR